MRKYSQCITILLFLSIILSSCASSLLTTQSKFNFQKIQRVALLNFEDFPHAANSGELVSSIFEKELLKTRLHLIERRQVEKILKEHAFDLSGVVDPSTAKEIGKLLGVDALILGNITVFTPEKRDVWLMDVKIERSEPIFKKEIEKTKSGNKEVTIEKEIISGYIDTTTFQKVPQSYISEAEVGLAVRMVDIQTGEILFVASSFEEGIHTQAAAEILSRRIAKPIKKELSKSK